MKKILGIVVLGLLLSGCAAEYTDSSINNYRKYVAPKISLGDTKSKTLSLLEPLHIDIPASWLRPPEQFTKNGLNYYIHFQRTGRIPDDRLTDDELTPYVFIDNRLTSIGWTAIGGPKTFGQTTANDFAGNMALMEMGLALMSGNTGTTSTTSFNSGPRYILSSNYVSGMNRICIYKLGTMVKTKTMNGISLCPMSY